MASIVTFNLVNPATGETRTFNANSDDGALQSPVGPLAALNNGFVVASRSESPYYEAAGGWHESAADEPTGGFSPGRMTIIPAVLPAGVPPVLQPNIPGSLVPIQQQVSGLPGGVRMISSDGGPRGSLLFPFPSPVAAGAPAVDQSKTLLYIAAAIAAFWILG